MRNKCANGHMMVKDNIYMHRGNAYCQECRRAARRKSAARKRAKEKKVRLVT